MKNAESAMECDVTSLFPSLKRCAYRRTSEVKLFRPALSTSQFGQTHFPPQVAAKNECLIFSAEKPSDRLDAHLCFRFEVVGEIQSEDELLHTDLCMELFQSLVAQIPEAIVIRREHARKACKDVAFARLPRRRDVIE